MKMNLGTARPKTDFEEIKDRSHILKGPKVDGIVAVKLEAYKDSGNNKVMAIRYSGRSMDSELVKRWPTEFRFAWISGCQSLIPDDEYKKTPYSGDWLIFDELELQLENVMENSLFRELFVEAGD